jgi:hypothetical protein
MSHSDHNFVLTREDRFARIRAVLEKFQDSADRVDYEPEERDRRENVGKVLD